MLFHQKLETPKEYCDKEYKYEIQKDKGQEILPYWAEGSICLGEVILSTQQRYVTGWIERWPDLRNGFLESEDVAVKYCSGRKFILKNVKDLYS